MLTPEDQTLRDSWLQQMAIHPFKHMIYCGKEITIADAERWLHDALDEKNKRPEL